MMHDNPDPQQGMEIVSYPGPAKDKPITGRPGEHKMLPDQYNLDSANMISPATRLSPSESELVTRLINLGGKGTLVNLILVIYAFFGSICFDVCTPLPVELPPTIIALGIFNLGAHIYADRKHKLPLTSRASITIGVSMAVNILVLTLIAQILVAQHI